MKPSLIPLCLSDVYASGEPIREGAHVYVQCYKADETKKCHLVLGENWELPDLSGATVAAGKVEIAPLCCTFFIDASSCFAG